MTYYIFKPASNTTETGSVYPQVQKMSPGYNYKAHNSVHALSDEVDEPNLDYFVVHNKAKLSDLLSVSVIHGGFLVSKTFKELLERFHLPNHRFYPARVYHRRKFYEYYWMHIICNLTDEVNYEKSAFKIYYNYAHNLGSINVYSKEDLLEKKEKVKADNPGKNVTIWGEKLYLKDSFNTSLDLFEIGTFDANTYIANRLKEEIEAQKITGCFTAPASNLCLKARS